MDANWLDAIIGWTRFHIFFLLLRQVNKLDCKNTVGIANNDITVRFLNALAEDGDVP